MFFPDPKLALTGLACLASASCATTLAPMLAPETDADATALRDGAYALDKKHASLLFKIDHLSYSLFVGRFEIFDASLDFDEADPANSSIEAVIDVASLDIANDAFAETLTGPDWFDAEQFPQARFRSTAIEITGDNTGTMTGDLTLHGVTVPTTLAVVFNGGARDYLRGGGYFVGFSAKGRVNRSDFGVDRFSGVLADAVDIEIEAEFKRRGSSETEN